MEFHEGGGWWEVHEGGGGGSFMKVGVVGVS